MTVRQVATSNSNLSVRVNGSVIRAVPGQVIRRVTGEIVRVLENGTLEPVDLQNPPKTIITSRDRPISLDSESDDTSSRGEDSSEESDFEVIRGDISSSEGGAPGRQMSIPSEELIRKIEFKPYSPPIESHLDPEIFDPELLTPAVDLTEGQPYTESSLLNMSAKSAEDRCSLQSSLYPSLTDAMTVDEDGEMRLDPDLFNDYIDTLAVRFGYAQPRIPTGSLSYLFLRRPRPKSQFTPYVPVPREEWHTGIPASQHSDASDSETTSCSSTEENEDEAKEEGSEEDEPFCESEGAEAIRTFHFYKGVKLSEPVELYEPFVVMDRLKTRRSKKTVRLRGLHRSRAGFALFESGKRDLFFNLDRCRVNEKTAKPHSLVTALLFLFVCLEPDESSCFHCIYKHFVH
ncbi:uncharacterized protein LOC100899064 [Galendromus occidentalis]|uniref:Uncharacterized protein LOC100899064 n=1 Tax=Galendromus occidentalis TaxID=34638 RepID=A0AAJ7L965_9ACAR|nr:uncharacterized protein LOC100899064 [Galendromus occidentalis]